MKKDLNIEEVCEKKKRLWTIGWVPSERAFATMKKWRDGGDVRAGLLNNE